MRQEARVLFGKIVSGEDPLKQDGDYGPFPKEDNLLDDSLIPEGHLAV